jgi:hypothetical protein
METGRYMVIMQSGRKFMVAAWGTNYVQWCDIDPATKKLNKITVKDTEVIDEHNTKTTAANGFKNICFLSPGTSALGYIDLSDATGLQRIVSDFVKYEK